MKISDIRPEVYDMAAKAQERLAGRFAEIDRVAEINTRRVMEAFQNNRVAEACFAGTTGYGYDDLGRETLDKIYAEIFGTGGRARPHRLCERYACPHRRDVRPCKAGGHHSCRDRDAL